MENFHILGTGNAMVTKCFNTCFTIENEGKHFLIDAGGGNGILKQLEKAKIDLLDIPYMFVSHCHIDHILGVIWLIRLYSAKASKNKAIDPLVIYGHEGVIKVLHQMMSMLLNKKQSKSLEGNLKLVEVSDGEAISVMGYGLTFFDIGSTKDQQFGCRFDLPSGKSVLFLGDEPYREAQVKYTVNIDYLLHEAFCLYAHRESFEPYKKHHVTAQDAGEISEKLGVPNVILYHTEDKHLEERKALYGAEAQAHYKGRVLVPDDLEIIPIM